MTYQDYFPRCPTCGKKAVRRHFNSNQENPHLVKYECPDKHKWQDDDPE